MVLKAGGERHCVKHPHSGRPPSGNGGLSGVPAGDSFRSGGLAQMPLFVFQMQTETCVEVTSCCKSC